MVRSLWTARTGMIAQQENVDVIANNIANVNTTGYKSEQAQFKSLLYQTIQTRSTNNVMEEKPVGAQAGLGTRTAAVTSIFRQGALTANESPLAVAIEGDGFFKVRMENGEIQYTRDGNFAASPLANGTTMICTSEGHALLDTYNNPIIIPAGVKATDWSVAADNRIAISRDGGSTFQPLRATAANGQQYDVSIGLVQFNNAAGLEKVSGNRYVQTVASGAAMEEANTQGLGKSKTHQGYIEASNVQLSEEVVNLIIAQRAYEMNSKIIQASDQMLEQANNLRR